ncbi:MAG: tRNA glutamyl-Q(34) synthetase GluQRS [Acidobacteriota bacterium]
MAQQEREIESAGERPRGRWAPSPSGLLHVGSARTALVAWLSIRAAGGTFLWRLEDLDPPRVMAGAAEAGMEDLHWLGLDWDEGCRRQGGEEGAFGPYAQSRRGDHYRHALVRLAEAGRLFPCRRTRRDLQDLARAPHGAPQGSPYPDRLRPRDLGAGWWRDDAAVADAALRFRVAADEVVFEDLLYGEQRERPDRTVGHFVLRRRDGLFAYQLAVVVDDLAMEIDEVVRGEDLLASTARQIQLAEALGGAAPRFGHVPLVLNGEGEKLSKRDRGLTLRALRDGGCEAAQVTGYLAASLGLIDEPRRCHPQELVANFCWRRLNRQDHRLPDDLLPPLRRIR